MHTTLVLGGARSGKSVYAERLARAWARDKPPAQLVYVATAKVYDDEMSKRVVLHQARRGSEWRTVEEPLALVDVLQHEIASNHVVLVDCLTLWLTNLLLGDHDTDEAVDTLCALVEDCTTPLMLVANEVGLGIVPETKLGRDFRDIAGIANQRLAAVSDRVLFIAAGLPMVLKGNDPLAD